MEKMGEYTGISLKFGWSPTVGYSVFRKNEGGSDLLHVISLRGSVTKIKFCLHDVSFCPLFSFFYKEFKLATQFVNNL